MLVHDCLHRRLAHATRLGDAWNLVIGAGDRDIGVEAGGRGRHQVTGIGVPAGTSGFSFFSSSIAAAPFCERAVGRP